MPGAPRELPLLPVLLVAVASLACGRSVMTTTSYRVPARTDPASRECVVACEALLPAGYGAGRPGPHGAARGPAVERFTECLVACPGVVVEEAPCPENTAAWCYSVVSREFEVDEEATAAVLRGAVQASVALAEAAADDDDHDDDEADEADEADERGSGSKSEERRRRATPTSEPEQRRKARPRALP